MDPKMDSGIVCKYYSIDEAIENGAAPVPISINKTVDVQCTIDIMDHLLACEVSAVLLFMISLTLCSKDSLTLIDMPTLYKIAFSSPFLYL